MAVYYVNGTAGNYTWTIGPGTGQTSPAGNDAEDGSLAHPWATIQKCETSGIAGSTIYVAEATYQEAYNAAYALSLSKGHTYQADGEVIVITNPGSPVTTALVRITGGTTTYQGDFKFSGTDLTLFYGSTSGTGLILKPDANTDKPTLTQIYSASGKYMAQSGGGSGQTWNINAHLVAADWQQHLFYAQSTAGSNTWTLDGCDLSVITHRGKTIFWTATNSVGLATIKNLIISLGTLASGYPPIYVAAGSWILDIDLNTMTIEAAGAISVYGMIHVTNQPSPIITDNTVNMNISSRDESNYQYGIYVYGTTEYSLGEPVVTGNNVNINAIYGVPILIGSNSRPSAGNINLATSVICQNNLIKGPVYYDPSWSWASGDLHGILVSNCLDPTITGNICDGCYLSIINKGNLNTIYTEGVTKNNIAINCLSGPMIRGVTDCIVEKNIILFITHGVRGFDVQYNDSVDYNNCNSVNATLKQNIVYVSPGLTGIYMGRCLAYGSANPPPGFRSYQNSYYDQSGYSFMVGVTPEDDTAWKARGYDIKAIWDEIYPQIVNNKFYMEM